MTREKVKREHGEEEEAEERESMSGCHQTRPSARRERTWLAWSRSGARGAARRERSSTTVEAGPGPSPRVKGLFFLSVPVSVFLCVCTTVCVRGAGTHGGVLDGHTEVFSVQHTTPHDQNHHNANQPTRSTATHKHHSNNTEVEKREESRRDKHRERDVER